MSKYKVHQSHLKRWEDNSTCKLKWYHQNVLEDIPRDDPSQQMIKGTYFETLAIGGNVRGEDLPDISFLYNANGSKKVELTRIEEQVDRFKELFNPLHQDYLGFNICDVQCFVEAEEEEGTIDFVAVDDFDKVAIFDLKFTADVDSDFGDFAWGRSADDIDWTQMKLYKRLYRERFGVDPLTYVIVFDASPRKGIRLFELIISDTSESEVKDRTSLLYRVVQDYQSGEAEPSTKPSKSECSTCKVDCPSRYEEGILKKIKVRL